MRLIDSAAEYLAKYLKTDTAKALADWDQQIQGDRPSEIEVYCVSGWRDATRALAASQLIDRAMRRGARAYRDAHGTGGTDSLFSSPTWFLQHLTDFPPPLHANQSGLNLTEVAGPPLALHLTPRDETWSVLAHAAASQVGYTMAAFGKTFSVEWITGRHFRPSDLALASVASFVERKRPAFEVTRHARLRAEDLQNPHYQSISSPPPSEHLGFEVHLVVQRVCATHVDVIQAWY